MKKKTYKTYGNILRRDDLYYVGIVCPVCSCFLRLHAIKDHVNRLKLAGFSCSNCSYLLKITFEYYLPRCEFYRQTTIAEKSKLRYKFPSPANYFLGRELNENPNHNP